MACELCDLVAGDVKTRLYYKDKVCIIVDCLNCGIPMVVIRHHGSASDEEKRLMTNAINSLFTYQSIRTLPRHIPNHEHWHLEEAQYHGS